MSCKKQETDDTESICYCFLLSTFKGDRVHIAVVTPKATAAPPAAAATTVAGHSSAALSFFRKGEEKKQLCVASALSKITSTVLHGGLSKDYVHGSHCRNSALHMIHTAIPE